jgi:hypothetical protein
MVGLVRAHSRMRSALGDSVARERDGSVSGTELAVVPRLRFGEFGDGPA